VQGELYRIRNENETLKHQLATTPETVEPSVREEREYLALIDQRDAAEDALANAFHLVTGEYPEWSNAFGYTDALEGIKETIASYLEAAKAPVAPTEER
jgi:hypothetical protein